MLNFLLGALAMLALVYLIQFANSKGLKVTWWQWLLTVLGIALAVITVASIAVLYAENEPQGAQFVALVLGLLTVVWGVLLGRFVFLKA